MSRLSVLASQPKLALGALLTLLLAAAAVVGSGADFTASSANPSNTFSSGTLKMENSKENAAILTAAGMKPGDSAVGTVDIKNTGSLGGTFSLARATPADSDATNPLSGKLNVAVVDCGLWSGGTEPTCGDGDDATKYSGGTLAQMSSAVALGSFAPDAKRRYQFKVVLDGSAGNEYQGDNTSVRFDFNAVQ